MTDPRETTPAELPALPWPPLLLFGAVVGAWAFGRLAPLAWPGMDDGPAHSIGIGIGLAGVALLVWSGLTLWRHGTTFLPSRAQATRLVTDGPYAIRRNPIYIADVLMLLGVAELTKNVWFVILAALFIPLVTWLAVLPEERHLEDRFGDAYRDYKATTRRWF
jgi:protein-S-isoprenylcysteine O-methyltransferase Ste14